MRGQGNSLFQECFVGVETVLGHGLQVDQQGRELQELLDVLVVLLVPPGGENFQAIVDDFELLFDVFVHNSDYLQIIERTRQDLFESQHISCQQSPAQN